MQVTIMIQGAQHTQDAMGTGEGAAPSAKGHSTGGIRHCPVQWLYQNTAPSDPNGHSLATLKSHTPNIFVSLEIC